MNGEAKQEAVLERLRSLEANGRLTAEAVIADARSKTSPLHGYFEWNDKAAAHKFRIVQARKLIATFEVSIIEESRILSGPTYVRDPAADSKEQGYVRTLVVRDDREQSRQVLVSEFGRLESYLLRVQSLAIAFGMESEVHDVATRVSELRDRLALTAA